MFQFQSWISTFAWQFNDILIVLISIFLSEKFKQIGDKIGSEKVTIIEFINKFWSRDKYPNFQKFEPSEWEEIRKAYTRLTHFCKIMNGIIFEMLAVSMLGNICYLSVYIFQAFKYVSRKLWQSNSLWTNCRHRTPGEAMYFWCNMIFVLFHFIVVSLYTARVNEESVKPLKHIFNIKSEYMHYEVRIGLK